MAAFENIYPFTTEFISGYMEDLNVGGKSVLTVGSSGDQAYNAYLYGASNVTVYDINKNSKSFIDVKSDILCDSSDRREFYYRVLDDKRFSYTSNEIFCFNSLCLMNAYMRDEDCFKKLQNRMIVNEVNFILGDVFYMDRDLGDKSFDVINLSNVLQYYKPKSMDRTVIRKELLELFKSFLNHLNSNGTVMVDYLYGNLSLINENVRLYDLIAALEDGSYHLSIIDIGNNSDSALVFKKGK